MGEEFESKVSVNGYEGGLRTGNGAAIDTGLDTDFGEGSDASNISDVGKRKSRGLAFTASVTVDPIVRDSGNNLPGVGFAMAEPLDSAQGAQGSIRMVRAADGKVFCLESFYHAGGGGNRKASAFRLSQFLFAACRKVLRLDKVIDRAKLCLPSLYFNGVD